MMGGITTVHNAASLHPRSSVCSSAPFSVVQLVNMRPAGQDNRPRALYSCARFASFSRCECSSWLSLLLAQPCVMARQTSRCLGNSGGLGSDIQHYTQIKNALRRLCGQSLRRANPSGRTADDNMGRNYTPDAAEVVRPSSQT